jgi:hypothetical protein
MWKVEWVDPNPGLREYVKSANIIVPWSDRRPFLRDEPSWDRLVDASDRSWPGAEHPLCDAVDTVLASTGEAVSLGTRGILSAAADVLERVAVRSKTEVLMELPGFRDRRGTAHLPFDKAVSLAQAFAAAEPQSATSWKSTRFSATTRMRPGSSGTSTSFPWSTGGVRAGHCVDSGRALTRH